MTSSWIASIFCSASFFFGLTFFGLAFFGFGRSFFASEIRLLALSALKPEISVEIASGSAPAIFATESYPAAMNFFCSAEPIPGILSSFGLTFGFALVSFLGFFCLESYSLKLECVIQSGISVCCVSC